MVKEFINTTINVALDIKFTCGRDVERIAVCEFLPSSIRVIGNWKANVNTRCGQM